MVLRSYFLYFHPKFNFEDNLLGVKCGVATLLGSLGIQGYDINFHTFIPNPSYCIQIILIATHPLRKLMVSLSRLSFSVSAWRHWLLNTSMTQVYSWVSVRGT